VEGETFDAGNADGFEEAFAGEAWESTGGERGRESITGEEGEEVGGGTFADTAALNEEDGKAAHASPVLWNAKRWPAATLMEEKTPQAVKRPTCPVRRQRSPEGGSIPLWRT
jgi:hypothetical protein